MRVILSDGNFGEECKKTAPSASQKQDTENGKDVIAIAEDILREYRDAFLELGK